MHLRNSGQDFIEPKAKKFHYFCLENSFKRSIIEVKLYKLHCKKDFEFYSCIYECLGVINIRLCCVYILANL